MQGEGGGGVHTECDISRLLDFISTLQAKGSLCLDEGWSGPAAARLCPSGDPPKSMRNTLIHFYLVSTMKMTFTDM